MKCKRTVLPLLGTAFEPGRLADTLNEFEGEELADEMMVFAGVTGSHLDQILFMMRKKGMKRIDYKAVLTDTNSQWTVPELFKELEKEHAAMHQL